MKSYIWDTGALTLYFAGETMIKTAFTTFRGAIVLAAEIIKPGIIRKLFYLESIMLI